MPLSSPPTVTLTTFTDFVAATGTARIGKARDAKAFYQQGYAPKRDFYKLLRDRIDVCFAAGWDASQLKTALKDVHDAKKISNYEDCRKGLTRWVGRKTIVSHPSLRETWESGGLRVTINPELHADINGDPHLIKHYFKADALSKQKANLILHLLGKCAPKETTVGVLDLRRSKLFTPTVEIAGMDALLDAEALAMSALWNAV